MHNLHLLIIGSSEEEIRANAAIALEAALDMHKTMGNRANAIQGDVFEFEFVPEQTMEDMYRNYHKEMVTEHASFSE